MRDRNSTAIAVHVIRGSGTKPSDIHVAGGDLELANGERHGPVDSKLVLLVAVGESSRLRRQLIEPACRNRVTHVAGSHRQELCRPNRDVNLCDWCLQFADVKPVEFEIDLFLHRGAQHQPGRGREERATSIADIRCSRYSRCVDVFLGSTRRAQRHHTDHQSTWHEIPRKPCEPSHNHLHGRRHRRDRHRSANLVARSAPSRVGRWQRRCRRAMPREHARIGVFLCGRRANDRVLSRGACDHTRPRPGTLGVDAPDHEKAITSISRRFSHIASRASRETLSAEREASPLPCTWTGGVKDGTAKGHNESGCRSRIRVRGERRLCANAGDNSQRNTDIRGSGSVCRRTWPRRRVIRSPVVG